MQKKDPKTEKQFLKYFFKTYIPPFTGQIPMSEEVFKHIYLSADSVQIGFRQELDQYSFSDILKKKLMQLFALWDELWVKYLCITTDDLEMGDRAFCMWASTTEIQTRWKEIRYLSCDIDSLAQAMLQRSYS